jgi:hypothetical protein
MGHVEGRRIPAELLQGFLVIKCSLHGIGGIHRHRMDVFLGDRSVPKKALMEMGQIAVRITLWGYAFINLEDMNLGPWNLLGGEILEHGPRGFSSADGKREDTTCSDGLAGGGGYFTI